MKSKINQEGFLLINKPAGVSSFYVIKAIRRMSGIKKVGHAGTLDPFATGLLIIALGKPYTRQLDTFMNLPKTYKGNILLGKSTDTLDPEGSINETQAVPVISEEQLSAVTPIFLEQTEQMVPKFSAKKINGERAYKLARAGIEFEPKRQSIVIHNLNLTMKQNKPLDPVVGIETTCSKGTYIRQLAYDIGKELGTVGYLTTLQRYSIGPYTLENASDLDVIDADTLSKYLFKLPLHV